jgi:hypothetical protein
MNHNLKKKLVMPLLTALTYVITAMSGSMYGQQIPHYPLSSPVFSPYLLNPASAGSTDFFNADLYSGWSDGYISFLAGGSARIGKPFKNHNSLPLISDFTNIGVGGYIFNERNGLYNNTGSAAIFSWHFKISADALRFISIGTSAKAVYSTYSGEPNIGRPRCYSLYPDIDLGVYYYSPALYAGISGLNLIRDITVSDTTGYSLPKICRHLNLLVGYRQVISRSYNILIEPSIIVSEDYHFSGKVKDMLSPMLKVYAGMFCAGSYLRNLDRASFFFIYKYPKFDLGAYFEMPGKTAYFKSPLFAELKIGVNISAIRFGTGSYNHW